MKKTEEKTRADPYATRKLYAYSVRHEDAGALKKFLNNRGHMLEDGSASLFHLGHSSVCYRAVPAFERPRNVNVSLEFTALSMDEIHADTDIIQRRFNYLKVGEPPRAKG